MLLKGKKIDSEFVTSYIEKCVNNNVYSADEMLRLAKLEISNIDSKILEAENLKKTRSKLLDVVLTFENKKSNKLEDIKILKLFNIKNKNICKFICDKIRVGPVDIKCLVSGQYQINDINFAIKQLIENKVIYKTEQYILQGELYQSYLTNVMREIDEPRNN